MLDKLVSLETAQKKHYQAGQSTSVLPGPEHNISSILEAHHRRTKQTVILSSLCQNQSTFGTDKSGRSCGAQGQVC